MVEKANRSTAAANKVPNQGKTLWKADEVRYNFKWNYNLYMSLSIIESKISKRFL